MDRTSLCGNCGSMVETDAKFRGVCGSAVSPDAPDATPTRETPKQYHAPPRTAGRRNRGMFALLAGMGIVAFLAVGAIFAVNLPGGEPQANRGSNPAGNPPPEAEALPETLPRPPRNASAWMVRTRRAAWMPKAPKASPTRRNPSSNYRLPRFELPAEP